MRNKLMIVLALASVISFGSIAFAKGTNASTTPAQATEKREERGERRGEEGEGNQREQARLKRQAKITMEQAKEIALRRAAGNVEGGELEREHGHLVYSFDIRNAKGAITEVQVDAKSGKVVRVEEENAKQEADEKRKEGRKP